MECAAATTLATAGGLSVPGADATKGHQLRGEGGREQGQDGTGREAIHGTKVKVAEAVEQQLMLTTPLTPPTPTKHTCNAGTHSPASAWAAAPGGP